VTGWILATRGTMPFYDYQCDACGHKFEDFHSIKETKDTCPECGDKKLRRLIGAPAFVLKGSGFHSNDYKDMP